MEFGELVTVLRRKAKLTQQDLADRVKISIQYLNQIEKGRAIESIGEDILAKLNTALNISTDEFNKIKSGGLKYLTENGNQKEESASKQLEIERQNWARIESMLKDIINRQDERIVELSDQVKFLKSLLEKN